MSLLFHPLVQKDLRAVLQYYEDEGGALLSDRFFVELETLIGEIGREPQKFHPVSSGLRRANMTRFPYHFLFRENGSHVRVLVLRHHKRHPNFGLTRSDIRSV